VRVAPIGIMECWNIGKMGLDLRIAEPALRPVCPGAGSKLGEDTARLGKWHNSDRRYGLKSVLINNDGSS